MSLPSHFHNSLQYFEFAVNFLREHEHLYNFPNIRVVTLKVFDKINIECDDDVFEPNFTLNDANDVFVREFLTNCQMLNANLDDFYGDMHLDIDVPLGPKKKHEIIYLAKEIMDLCDDTKCDTVVDFGSGLGYLDQLVNEISGFNVLGIECNSEHCAGAVKRQNKYHPNTKEKVKFKIHTIRENSDVAIRDILHETFITPGNICLTGLHACADLAVTAMNLFIKIPEAKAMVIIPCCYHKMEIIDENLELFGNFPLSDTFKAVFNKYNCWEYMRTPFLRLAAQPSTVGTSLKDLVFNLLARSVIQYYADLYGYKLIRKKRKAVKTKDLSQNFHAYIHNADANFSLNCNNHYCNTRNGDTSCKCNLKFNIDKVTSFWREICTDAIFKKAAIFILMQRHLQSIFENLILFDRRVYMEERGFNCYFKRVVDHKISPRCLGLIVKK